LFYGALVGPIANRVSQATVEITGQRWQLEANEGATALHGGKMGLFALDWAVTETSAAHVSMRCDLPHGYGGLPGNRTIEVTYRLCQTGSLHLEITAQSDQTTPMNIAHHPYWTLAPSGSIGGHLLECPATSFVETDEKLLPTGRVLPVADTLYDFRTPRRVPTGQTIDINLCLRNTRSATPQKCAELSVPGRARLEIFSTEPGLQVYNGTGLNELPVPLHDGRRPAPCDGIALEPQGWPDAPNNPQFPSILLDRGAIYRQITQYRIAAEMP
jgi:aldose 1-epimerase